MKQQISIPWEGVSLSAIIANSNHYSLEIDGDKKIVIILANKVV